MLNQDLSQRIKNILSNGPMGFERIRSKLKTSMGLLIFNLNLMQERGEVKVQCRGKGYRVSLNDQSGAGE